MPIIPPPKRPYWNPPKPKENSFWDNPWYNTRRWQKLSKQTRFLDYPRCQAKALCINYAQCKNLADITDHIIPVDSGKTLQDKEHLMWYGELQPICKACHAAKSAKEKKQ